jgi:hypothetical protein
MNEYNGHISPSSALYQNVAMRLIITTLQAGIALTWLSNHYYSTSFARMNHMGTSTFNETLEEPQRQCHFTHRQSPAHFQYHGGQTHPWPHRDVLTRHMISQNPKLKWTLRPEVVQSCHTKPPHYRQQHSDRAEDSSIGQLCVLRYALDRW